MIYIIAWLPSHVCSGVCVCVCVSVEPKKMCWNRTISILDFLIVFLVINEHEKRCLINDSVIWLGKVENEDAWQAC